MRCDHAFHADVAAPAVTAVPQKSEGLDQVSFARESTDHGSERVDIIKNADGAAKLRALQKGIFHQHRQG